MKGYIKRLSQDIEKLDAKLQALVKFKDSPREPINNEQYILLCNQEGCMRQLLNVMKLRLTNEQKIHPNYFEDLPEEEIDDANDCDGQEIVEE